MKQYLALAKEFSQRELEQLEQVMENHRPIFRNDMHWGLVKETFKALLRSNIQNLTRTFLTLSLEDISRKANLTDSREAERILRSMVYRKEISAVIDQRAQMVRFEPIHQNGVHTKASSQVWNVTNRCVELYSQLVEFYQSLLTDPQYMFPELSQDGEDILDHSFC